MFISSLSPVCFTQGVSFSLRNYQMSIVPQLMVRFLAHLIPSMPVWSLGRFCACCHNFSEFLYITVFFTIWETLLIWCYPPLLALKIFYLLLSQRLLNLGRRVKIHLCLSMPVCHSLDIDQLRIFVLISIASMGLELNH